MTHRRDVILIVGGAAGRGMGAAVAASLSRGPDIVERIGDGEIPVGKGGHGAEPKAGRLVPDLRFPKEPKARDWEQRSRKHRSQR
jgi:hypothetical protein